MVKGRRTRTPYGALSDLILRLTHACDVCTGLCSVPKQSIRSFAVPDRFRIFQICRSSIFGLFLLRLTLFRDTRDYLALLVHHTLCFAFPLSILCFPTYFSPSVFL